MTGIGHNSDNVTGQRLKSFIERIERMEEEKKAIATDIKEIYAELQATGFDKKTIRKIVALRKIDPDKRREEEMILETYLAALGE